MVVHACKLYTPNVHQMFCEIKDESEFYRSIEVEPGKRYIAEHYDLERVHRWCKGRYNVDMDGESGKYTYECGLLEHFGLPCAHILRVSGKMSFMCVD